MGRARTEASVRAGWRVTKADLAFYGVDNQTAHGGTFPNERRTEPKAGLVHVGPPLNMTDWRARFLRDGKRRQPGVLSVRPNVA